MLLVLLSMGYTRRMDKGHGEFYALLMFALAGVMLVSGVSDLLTLFVDLFVDLLTLFVDLFVDLVLLLDVVRVIVVVTARDD